MVMASIDVKIRHVFGDTPITEASIGAAPPGNSIAQWSSLSFTISGGAAPTLPSVKQVAPKTWRISASADAIWFLRLKVITTDRPRSQALDKVLRPPGFFTNIFQNIIKTKMISFLRLCMQKIAVKEEFFFNR